MPINARNKGKAGESELINRLQPFFNNPLKRNLEQVRSGGSDIDGSHPFCIEVKRVEDTAMGNKRAWWRQVRASLSEEDEIPIVAYRPNKNPWRYLIPTTLLLLPLKGEAAVEFMEVSEDVFIQLVLATFK